MSVAENEIKHLWWLIIGQPEQQQKPAEDGQCTAMKEHLPARA